MRPRPQSISAAISHADSGSHSHRLNGAKHPSVGETRLIAVMNVNIKGHKQHRNVFLLVYQCEYKRSVKDLHSCILVVLPAPHMFFTFKSTMVKKKRVPSPVVCGYTSHLLIHPCPGLGYGHSRCSPGRSMRSSAGSRTRVLMHLSAFLPRGGSADPVHYLMAAPRGRYNERELPYYPRPHPVHPPRGGYPRPSDLRVADLQHRQYYPCPPAHQHRGPFRQDVPPSPPQHHRVPVYQEIGRAGPRGGSPDQHRYRNQDPRQKNPMTAAV